MSGRDIVNHPSHYNGHASRVECADLILATNSLLGLAIKHVWRCGEKHDGTCPVYVRSLHYRMNQALVGDDIAVIIAGAFESNLPCAHCAKIDRKKSAWYLRALSKWLLDPQCHAVPYGLAATMNLARRIYKATDGAHPLRLVLEAAWGDGCDGFTGDFARSDENSWNLRYSNRCLAAADLLEKEKT